MLLRNDVVVTSASPFGAHPDTDDGRLWHYTTTEGLIGIVSGGALRATALPYLNDTAEGTYYLDATVQACRRLLRMPPTLGLAQAFDRVEAEARGMVERTYVVCASAEPDDLTQWRGYGTAGAANYALALRADEPFSVRLEGGGRLAPPRIWQQVVYVSRRHVDTDAKWTATLNAPELARLNSSSSDEEIKYAARLLLEVAATIKDPSFKSEREWRLVVIDPDPGAHVGFRSALAGVAAYITLEHEDQLPLGGLCVGPGWNQAPAELGARRLLQRNGYKVPVTTSAIPFRG